MEFFFPDISSSNIFYLQIVPSESSNSLPKKIIMLYIYAEENNLDPWNINIIFHVCFCLFSLLF